jgi:preprotein translocase subunit Sss1
MRRKTVVIAILVVFGIVGAVGYVVQLYAFRKMDPLAVWM